MEHHHSHVQWCAALAGAVIAAALSLVLLQFGAAVGIADMDTLGTNVEITRERLILAGVFVLLVQVITAVLGGYLAGRLRGSVGTSTPHESEVHDGAHGLLAWAILTVGFVIAGSVIAAIGADTTSVDAGKAQDVLDREHALAVWMAFAAGATSLVSAVAAWAAAVKGGDHRDRQVDFSRHISFRRNV